MHLKEVLAWLILITLIAIAIYTFVDMDSRLKDLEESSRKNKRNNSWIISDEDSSAEYGQGLELNDWEIEQLKEFTVEYLPRNSVFWKLDHLHNNNLRKPVKAIEVLNLWEEVERLEELIIHPEKLEELKDRLRLEKEIEEKQEELNKMK